MRAVLAHEASVSPDSLEAIQFGLEIVGVQLPAVGGLSVELQPITAGSFPRLNAHQIDGSRVLDDVPDWHNRELTILATDKDLGHKSVNFLFGLSRFAGGKAVFSSNRLEDSPLAIAGLVAHEVGHSFGLVGEHKQNYDALSQFAGHCVNTCLMRPVNNKAEMIEAANMVQVRPAESGFCDDCVVDLRQVHFAN